MIYRKLVLFPHQTMKQAVAKERLNRDVALVHAAVRSHEGIEGKRAIAEATGLSVPRVHDCIVRINNGETGHTRLEYGVSKARGGPNAGQKCAGWFAMDLQRHHHLMLQGDFHEAITELGVRRKRLIRFAQAQGITGAEAKKVVAGIECLLGKSIEVMTERDLAAFEAFIADEIAAAETAG